MNTINQQLLDLLAKGPTDYQTAAKKLGIAYTTASRALGRLRESGKVKIVNEGKRGPGGRPATYGIN